MKNAGNDSGHSGTAVTRISLLKAAEDATSPHLPASCLGKVLNFLWYTGVRQCMLTGKIMAVEAARHVETLNITNSSELFLPAARRFSNIAEVNVLCLLSASFEECIDRQKISSDAATRTVPFLIGFPNLRRAFIGGLAPNPFYESVWSKITYDFVRCDREPDEGRNDHRLIFRHLLLALIGAFQTRALDAEKITELGGVLLPFQRTCYNYKIDDDLPGPDHSCKLCQDMISCFPLSQVVKTRETASYDCSICRQIIAASICMTEVDVLKIVEKRPGGVSALGRAMEEANKKIQAEKKRRAEKRSWNKKRQRVVK